MEKNQKERIEELSQKLFNKPSKDVKYLLVTHHVHENLLEEEITRTGLYQWINVFEGEVKNPRDVENFNDYDIVQVNMSTQDIPLVNDIKESLPKDSKTKIVLNNDYTTELWQSGFSVTPYTLSREVEKADMIFGTEYFQATSLSELTGRQVFVIPHPADVKRLKSLTPIPKKKAISTIWRRYDNFSYIPYLAVRNHGVQNRLIGFDEKKDPKVWLTTSLYDVVLAGTNYFDYCDLLRESLVVYDPFTLHSYNRGVVDCASLGVPVVGSNRTQSVNVCFPYTKVDPFDTKESRRLIEKLLVDEEFRKKVVDYAKEHAELYNHENSKEKYLKALSETTNKSTRKPKYSKDLEPVDFEKLK